MKFYLIMAAVDVVVFFAGVALSGKVKAMLPALLAKAKTDAAAEVGKVADDVKAKV